MQISTFIIRTKLKDVEALHLDFKGNYGVAVNWSDGHFMDIFPFEVLKEVAESLQEDNL